MTQVKITGGKLSKKVAEALAPHVDELFTHRSGRWMAVVELVHDDRTEPGLAPDGNPTQEASVRLRVADMELAAGEDEHHLRTAARALYAKRTASGTLLEGQEPDWAESDLRTAAGLIAERV